MQSVQAPPPVPQSVFVWEAVATHTAALQQPAQSVVAQVEPHPSSAPTHLPAQSGVQE